MQLNEADCHHRKVGGDLVVAEAIDHGLEYAGDLLVRAADDFVVGLGGGFAPVPGVFEGFDLCVADGAGLFAEEDVVGGLGIEGWVEVDEVDGVVGDVMAKDVEVVAVVEDVGLHSDQ